jgi:hypothetical protein
LDLWVPLGIAHVCGSFESATQNISIMSKTIVSFGFHSICHNWWFAFYFPCGFVVVRRYFKDSLGTHTLFHCPFSLMSEWSFNSLMKGSSSVDCLGSTSFKGSISLWIKFNYHFPHNMVQGSKFITPYTCSSIHKFNIHHNLRPCLSTKQNVYNYDYKNEKNKEMLVPYNL